MKAICSDLAEKQTVKTYNVESRISVRVRECEDGVFTNDVMVDGYIYTPAVSDEWLRLNLLLIGTIVSLHPDQRHLGMGQWEDAR